MQRRYKMKRNSLFLTIAVLCVILGCLLWVATGLDQQPQEPSLQNPPSSDPSTNPSTQTPTTQPTTPSATVPVTEPTEPPIIKEATATIGATGDILMHDLVIASGYDKATGTFNYDNIFTHFSDYVSMVDYAVANLEVTLIQRPETDGLLGYNGYPNFNSPDEVAVALKDAGFDMLLTANNHSYDSRHNGFVRTQQVIQDLGLTHIGTRQNESDANYVVVDVNGIKIGMINYTYNTGIDADGSISLNTIPLSVEDSRLTNSFNYNHLDDFYKKLSGEMEAMEEDGAEAIVLYIHWGDEYKTTPNSWQTQMAQQLCNMGIDVIVGNHAHVPQPVELLTSETNENQKTLCLYSTGNAVSNIYKTSTRPVHTEDGMLFTFTFAKYSDGTVVVESTDVLPTWVWRYDDENGVRKFRIMTLDREIEDWKTHLGISDDILSKCRDSYDRTMAIVGDGLNAANTWFADNQANVEAALGIR